MYALTRSLTNKSVQKVPPKSDDLRKTAEAGSHDLFSMIYIKINVRPKLCRPSQEAQRTSPFKTYLPNLIPFKDSTDARSQDLFSRIYLKINVRPSLCMLSQEAQRTSPFKTYLPNLTPFKKSSRRWNTGFMFNDLAKNECAAQAMYALTRSPTNKPVQNVPPKSDGLPKFQPTLDHRFYFKGFI